MNKNKRQLLQLMLIKLPFRLFLAELLLKVFNSIGDKKNQFLQAVTELLRLETDG